MTRADVLHVIPFGSPAGGTERSVADLIASPLLAGVSQRVVFLRDSADGPFADADVVRPEAGGPARRLLAATRATRPRVVQSWLFPANLVAAVTRPVYRLPLVTAERNLGVELSRVRQVLERAVGFAECVAVANSTAVRDAAIGRIPGRAATLRVIEPGIEDRAPAAAEHVWDCVMVGRLSAVKDHATALAAFASLARDGVVQRVAIVGDGPERAAIAARIEALGLRQVVTMAGEADPAQYLSAARSYLSSSIGEGWSRAMLEALRAGLPVVSTAVGGALDLPPSVATLAPVGDAAGLAAGLHGLLVDEPARTAAASAARALFLARFRSEGCHAAYRDLYRELGVV
jgi:glycosyltransferase involved in cell wall biosynthesis